MMFDTLDMTFILVIKTIGGCICFR